MMRRSLQQGGKSQLTGSARSHDDKCKRQK
jgi:hypothetical protein